MEGYLKKWVNIIYRWKSRYFILKDHVLEYYTQKGEEKLGSIHLKVSSISESPNDALRIIIHSGTKDINILTKDLSEKHRWYNALKQAQEDSFKNRKLSDVSILAIEDKDLSEETKDYFKNSQMHQINDQLAQIWSTQALIQENLSIIYPKVDKFSVLHENLNQIENISTNIKQQVTLMVKSLEDEKKKLYLLSKFVENKQLDFENSPEKQNQQINRDEPIMDILNNQLQDITQFLSFNNDILSQFYDGNEQQQLQQQKHHKQPSIIQYAFLDAIHQQNDQIAQDSNQQLQLYDQALAQLKLSNPYKYNLLTTNPMLSQIQFTNAKIRSKLPVDIDVNVKINIWQILKDMIGKDITKFSVPVQLNEPLSMLHRLGDLVEYSSILDQACQQDNSCLRMVYIMAFSFSALGAVIDRTKKPFNPLLGETLDFEGSNCRFLAEQVSHHPPISACFVENQNYSFYTNTNAESTFWGKSLDLTHLSSVYIKLKKWGDEYQYNKPKTVVQNILVGKMYVDHYNESNFKNTKSGDYGQMVYTQRGWTDIGEYEGNGVVRDRNGVERYRLVGKWNSYLDMIDVNNQQKTRIWERTPVLPNASKFYNFTHHHLQMNYLNIDTLKKIPNTDSRLRPDQRALEYGNYELASTEKDRLEVKQRLKRKQNGPQYHHVPKWFEEKHNFENNELEYIYKGGYWEARETQAFTDIPEIY